MGIYTDLANSSTTIDPNVGVRVGLDRSSAQQLLAKAAQHDPAVGSLYAAADEVISVGDEATAASGDTYTLTFEFPTLGLTVTTGAIAYDDDDSGITTDIDSAFTSASFPGWMNGDITVTGGDIATAPVILTFDGDSVDETPVIVTLTPTGFTYGGTITRTTAGQGNRTALQALVELGAIAPGTVPAIGGGTPTFTKGAPSGQSKPRAGLIKDLAKYSIAEDGTDEVYLGVAALYSLPL